MSMLTEEYGIRADSKIFTTTKHINMPDQIGDKVATMNQQGFMRVELDPFSNKWISEAIESEHVFLEIGAAYGEASLAALEGGATIVANDIEMNHLRVISNRVNDNLRKNLYLNCASVPEQLNIPDNSIGGVLFCRVGHFFTTEEMQDTLVKIYNMLIPGGGLFFISVSPYHYAYKEFLPVFLERQKNGDQNPGYINNMKKYMPSPESAKYVPDFLNMWDVSVISNILKINSFEINKGELFDYSKNNSNGKGFTGIHAIKPFD